MEDQEKKYIDSEGHYFPTSEIKVGSERARKSFPQKELEELKTSILEYGQFQPSIIKRDMTLVMGERRLRACKDLGRSLWCVFTDELDPLTLKEMELEENVCREGLTAVDEILWKEEIHNLKKEKYKGKDWSLANTAELLGQSKSLTAEDVKLASYLKSMPEQFLLCESKSDIRKQVKKLEKKLDWDVHEAKAETFSEEERDALLGKASGISFEIAEAALQAEREEVTSQIVTPEEEEEKATYLRTKIKSFGLWLGVGDTFELFPKVKDGIIGVCFLDPPWGVDLDSKLKDLDSKNDLYNDSEESFKDSFPLLCKIAYEKMSTDSHLYCFFGIVHHEFVYSSLEAAGFNVNRRPIICSKIGIHSTRVGDYWYGASYEAIAFAKKGNRKLIIPGATDSFEMVWLPPSQKLFHPSAKPLEVYRKLLRVSAMPGDIICDPMYGTGAAFAACESMPDLKLSWFGWDSEKENRSKALMRLSEALLGGEFKEKEFMSLSPETPEWLEYWQSHPQEQNEMLDWLAKRKEEKDD